MFTYISTAWVLPAFVGPPASAWLTVHLSWHWVFFAVIPLALFGGVMASPSLLGMIRLSQPGSDDAPQASAAVGCCATAPPPLLCNLLGSGWTGSGWDF